jgi:hypothetical protein
MVSVMVCVCLWEKLLQIRAPRADVPAAHAVALEQAALPAVVAGFAFIFGDVFFTVAARLGGQPLGDA